MKDIKRIIIIGIFVVITILGIILIKTLADNGVFNNATIYTTSYTNITKTNKEKTTQTFITVEIKGEVYYPGVYKFYKDEIIVADVINAAGGLTPKADTSLVNCASLVGDHTSITIVSKGYSSYVENSATTQTKININTCKIEDLETLEGIGTIKATKIVTYRTKNGFFTSIEDLYKKEIITEALFEKIKEYITV